MILEDDIFHKFVCQHMTNYRIHLNLFERPRQFSHPVEDIDFGVTRQEGRVILRVIARSPELSVKIMGQRWAETRIWLKACSYNHCYSRLVV